MVAQMPHTLDSVMRGSGYTVLTHGFEDTRVTLYYHRDNPSQNKKVGDVAYAPPLVSPKSLTVSDKLMLLGKQKHGMFEWKPGSECMARKFYPNQRFVRDKLGGTREVKGEPQMGCEWCRQAAIAPELPQGPQGVVDEAQAGSKPPANEGVTPPASVLRQAQDESPPSLKCGQCEFTTAKGEMSLMAHFSHKHSGTRRARTRKGAGRRN